jgi:hypothetical protein
MYCEIGFILLAFTMAIGISWIFGSSQRENMTSQTESEVAATGQSHRLIIISGISGSGKTTVGRAVAERLGYAFVDQDSFYRDDKPRFTLPDGHTASNWDCAEALDLVGLRRKLVNLLRTQNVVFTAFAPVDEWIGTNKIRDLGHTVKHIHLATTGPGTNVSKYSELAIKRCIDARIVSKNLITREQKAKDDYMVRNVVYPAYLENQKNYYPDCVVDAFDGNGRRHPLYTLTTAIAQFGSS